jgi:hypothetical protein
MMEERKIINRSNYEIYFIDYYDGNLNDLQKKELFTFLSENRDLKAEFERFSNISLPKEKAFFDKDKLKKNTITLYNYKTYFIAWYENDLSREEKIEVERFLEVNPALQKEFELFRQTKLLPDNTIRFRNKNSLKKGGKVIPLNTWIYRSAAIAACIAVVFIFLYRSRNESGKTVAVTVPSVKEATSPAQHQFENKTSVSDLSQAKVHIKTAKAVEQKQQRQLAIVEPANELKNSGADTSAVKSQPLTASATIVINELPGGDTVQKPYQVFTDEELAELGLKEQQKQQTLLNKTAATLGKKLFGENAKLENSTNEQDLSRTFALAVGTFEFSRTTTR